MPAAPRRLLTRSLLAAVLGVSAAFTVACGSSGSGKGLLSAAESRTIISALNGISSGVRQHSCARVRTEVQALDNALSNLSGASSKLVQNLGHGATTVRQLAQSHCAHPQKTTASSSTTSTSTTPTTTTSTTTSTSTQATTTQGATTPQSVPTTTSNPQTTPATTPSTAPPGNGHGHGHGKGNGKGNGGGAGLGGGGPQ